MRLLHIPGVHCPRSDTALLAQALEREPLQAAAVADICAGSGVLAIAAALRGARPVFAVDVSHRALLATALNARLNGCRVHVRRGDLLDALAGLRFDLIVCNPPYVPAASDALPRHRAATATDAGRDGRALLDRVCRHALRHLRPGGTLLLVHSSVCGVQATCEALARGGLCAEVIRRERGPLGPLLSERSALLRARGLLGAADEEELVIIRARAAAAAGSLSRPVQVGAGEGSGA